MSGRRGEKTLMKSKGGRVDPTFQPIVRAFENDASVRMGKMGGNVLTVNGKMFAWMQGRNLVLKLGDERIAALVDSGTGRFLRLKNGALMKTWIEIEPGKGNWIKLAEESCRFMKERKR